MSQDAATVVGLAGTALAFAGTIEEEAERWLCALRLYGEAGALLQALGVGEEPRHDGNGWRGTPADAPRDEAPSDLPDCEARMAAVLTCADQFAARRAVEAVGTTELLLGVMRVYGATFDRALERRGTDRVELLVSLTSGDRH